jgi:hypothetical protein
LPVEVRHAVRHRATDRVRDVRTDAIGAKLSATSSRTGLSRAYVEMKVGSAAWAARHLGEVAIASSSDV